MTEIRKREKKQGYFERIEEHSEEWKNILRDGRVRKTNIVPALGAISVVIGCLSHICRLLIRDGAVGTDNLALVAGRENVAYGK